jgi:hypothetical protein
METVNVFADPITGIGYALWMAFTMFWQMLWALILGFTLSGVIR